MKRLFKLLILSAALALQFAATGLAQPAQPAQPAAPVQVTNNNNNLQAIPFGTWAPIHRRLSLTNSSSLFLTGR